MGYKKNWLGILTGDGHITHDTSLMNEVKDGFAQYGVKFEHDCNLINSWTQREVKQAALLSNGGRMIALDEDCMDDMYVSSVDERSKVLDYVKDHVQQGVNSTRMFTVQSFIQQNGHMKVPLSADLNKDILSWIDQGVYTGVNLVEVNNVCAYGPDISSKLGATVSSADRTACNAACRGGCAKYSDLPICKSLSMSYHSRRDNASILI